MKFEDFDEQFTLRRIVYVNSASHGYSEFELDESLAMFGGNNRGKTGTLAGTKIALYPEVSFKECEQIFKFVGKKGKYSYEDSYEYYFPDPRSFIVLEIENTHGRFCMVCYKTGNYGYGRFFIPKSYSDIRNLFVIEVPVEDDQDYVVTSKKDEPNYELNPDVSVSILAAFCESSGGVKINSKTELAKLMFGSRLDIPERSRFCVLPLVSEKEDAISAFRSIYQLAFENTDDNDDDMAAALATLVEMKRSRDKEKLDANLKGLVEEYDDLNTTHERLQRFKNALPLYKDAKSALVTAAQSHEKYSAQFNAVTTAFQMAYIENSKKLEALSQQHREILSQKKQLQDQFDETSNNKQKKQGGIDTLGKQITSLEKELAKAKELRATYTDKSDKEVINIYDEEIAYIKSTILQYKEEDGAAKVLKSRIDKKNTVSSQVKELKAKLERASETLLQSLNNEQDKHVLFSLNSKLSNPVVKLDQGDKDTISAFAELFSVDGAGYLTIKGSTIDGIAYKQYDMEYTIQEWKSELIKKEDLLSDLESDLVELNRKIKNTNVESLLKEEEKELKKAEKEMDLITSIGQTERRLEEMKSTKALEEDSLDSLSITVEELKNKLSVVSSTQNQIYQELQNTQQVAETFDKIRSRIEKSKSIAAPSDELVFRIEPTELRLEHADDLYEFAGKHQSDLSRLRSVYLRLEYEVPHPDIDTEKQVDALPDFIHRMNIYQNSFTSLEYDLKKLSDEIVAHNERVTSQLRELQDSEKTLLLEQNDINTALNAKSVSNLSEVRLDIQLKSSFTDIMNTLKKHDIYKDKFLDRSFYDTITRFVARFFDKNTGRLKLKDIIKGVSYSYRNKETGHIEKKSQSGGTSTTITAFMISVLMSRITESGAKLKMPIIVDEIGTLDTVNTAATISQITEHGFSVFCATPSFSALVAETVGRYIFIDVFHVQTPMVQTCHLKNIPRHVGIWGEK